MTTNQAVPAEDVVNRLSAEEVLDEDGKSHNLGELIRGRRTCLVFIRHFCRSCPESESVRLRTEENRVHELSGLREGCRRAHTTRFFTF